ncbi:MAG TPA: DUF3488 and transglutaminase-like domain-containing protein, partial [Acidimicrobiales bacterium]|nr:DUF3488 and transglutaminase-like domain-containing protein [Acidimicrobiales bacterium]
PAAAPERGTPAAPAPRGPRPRLTERDPTFVPTLALTAVTMSVALGYARLLTGRHWLWPAILTTLAAHAVAWWCRRARVPTAIAGVATIAATLLVGAWTVLGHTTAYGLPTGDTLSVLGHELARARDAFEVAKPPADDLPGFVAGVVLSIGITAFLADWAAFRVQSVFESCVPAFSLFLFESVFARGRSSIIATVVFAACALAFLVAQGMMRQNRAGMWFGGRAAGGIGALVSLAASLIAVAVIGGPILGIALPGYGTQGFVRPKAASGPGARATLSPLVDIRGRLADQSNVEVFTVVANAPAYWRVTALDTFDGKIWSSNESYRNVRSRLTTTEPLLPDVPTVRVTQQFNLRNLNTIWLPLAYRPVRVSGLRQVSYNADTASLITPSEVSNYLEYSIDSDVPTPTRDELRAAPAIVPQEVADRYLPLPPISARVRDLALRITAGAATPYDKAFALQQFFRDNFKYELNVRQGHDETALENFLFRDRRGYCEQFAGAYAVMARAIGLPARVAVGFTPGELRDDGVYHVYDVNAHAWPEVYLHGYGFVPFEPTPGRGNQLTESYTGVPPQQAAAPGATGVTEAPTTTINPADETPSTQPLGPDAGGAGAKNKAASRRGLNPVVGTFLAVVLALALLAAATALLRLRQRRRWREGIPSSPPRDDDAGGPDIGDPATPATSAEPAGKAPPPVAQVWAAWEDAADALRTAGIRRASSETPIEFGSRSANQAGLGADAARALRLLSRDAAGVVYSTAPVVQETADRSRHAAASVRAEVMAQLTWWDRTRSWIDPRTLVVRDGAAAARAPRRGWRSRARAVGDDDGPRRQPA